MKCTNQQIRACAILAVVVSILGWILYLNSSSRQRDSRISRSTNLTSLQFRDHLQFVWSPPVLPDHLQSADQRDSKLIRHIREHWIIPPFTGRRNLPNGTEAKATKYDYSEQGQPTWIDNVLGHRRDGFVVECGAADGLITSNSLWLELQRNWSGILIEANPLYFQQLLKRRRHMYMLNACLSPSKTPEKLNFTVDGIGGGISELVPSGQQKKRRMNEKEHIMIQCFPLYSILVAIGVVHVDYFSLDVEGAEIPVLDTIPFDDVVIDSFSIEKRVVNDFKATKQKTQKIEKILSEHSYKVSTMKPLDIILVRR